MSAVSPSTRLLFLKGVPLEATYENTVFWDTATGATKTTQAQAFANYTKPNQTDKDGTVYSFNLTNLSYQRYGRNQIKVQIPMDMLLDCNYLMFNNDRFGAKWFYAFITKLEYVSEVVTLVSYEIDVLQTWAFDYYPNSCFIERAHSKTDIIGENLVEENFELGDYNFSQAPRTSESLKVMGYYIAAPWKADITYGEQGERTITINEDAAVGGIYISGIYSGIYINRFSDLEDVKAVIAKASEELGDKAQAIVSLYCAPYQAGAYDAQKIATVTDLNIHNDVSTFGGYVAHNRKLFTYPYRGFQAFTGDGSSHTYRYEYFEGARNIGAGLPDWACSFDIVCDATPSGTCYLVPVGYKQWRGQSGQQNWYESMPMGGYPTIAFTTDSYKQYLAQDGVVQVLGGLNGNTTDRAVVSGFGKAIGGVIGGVASLAAGNIAGGLTNIAGSVFGALSENAKADNMPNNTQGATSSGQLKMKLNRQQFQLSGFTIQREFAERIDAFWDWFGYSQKKVASPERHARKWWTYIKTQGCTINGSIPADDERKICDLYNAGIRWWTDITKVDDFYNLAADNKPILEITT